MRLPNTNRLVATLVAVSYAVGLLSAPYVKYGLEKYVTGTPTVQPSAAITGSGGVTVGDLGLFDEAYRTISENYYGFDAVSRSALVSGMIKGMVSGLGDKHSDYFDIEETKKFNETISGDFEGIGAVVDSSDFGVTVKQILAGSPAKEAGVLKDDVISKVNGEKLEWLDLADAIEHIRGPSGTVAKLEILRHGESAPIVKEVVRRKITVPSVDGKMIEGTKTAYVMLSMFGEKTASEFAKTYGELRAQGAETLILDLRDNGGGLLETAVEILSNFVPKDKVLVTTKENNPFMNRSYFSYGPSDIAIPVVVLVNENTASASEITAGALKDYGKAVIVGTKTYGKGSVQQPFVLSDGSELKITVAKWYTPSDRGIDKIGIEPDVNVEFKKEDYENRFDRQLDTAKKVVEEIRQHGRDAALSKYSKAPSPEINFSASGSEGTRKK